VTAFWLIFVLDLALYGFCLCADTRYVEALPGMPDSYPDVEPRRCDDCCTDVSEARVKHCQTCGWCMEGFDHHCRYLNVCVGGRTYPAWYTFVLLLFLLVVMCAVGCVQVLNEPFRHNLHEEYPTVFYVLLGTAAVASVIESLFLLALLAQHSYFCLAGITTLEYIKDQAPPFPSLPPRGWREAISQGECHNCHGLIQLSEAADADEVLYCSVCQGDLAKAAVNFWQCDVCDNSAVCPICYRAATSSATVTTYRASAMKRRSQALMGILDTSRHGGGSSKNRTPSIHSRLSSFSGEQREVRMGRKSVGAVVAAVEGHAGESRPSFVSGCCGRREEESETESSSEGG
ncbi:Probable protein S-acyltransferase 22 (Probable palmitoyltransferase At1g69420) (Zinc finger DHHC domain-containing protein At1g69420), partial [Durusdinium trenchii]